MRSSRSAAPAAIRLPSHDGHGGAALQELRESRAGGGSGKADQGKHRASPFDHGARAGQHLAMFTSLADVLRDTAYDEIEVVGLGDGGIAFAKGGGSDATVTWTRRLNGREQARLQELIKVLPNGESARCHMPGFGLRIWRGQRQQRVSLCFRCNNAYVADQLTTFEASSAEATELLSFLRAFGPPDVSPSE